ncbi:MAG: alpha/beta fold hydrolase [Actinomycetota bacterium]|nr:alpha/beta fold hydrolase [Actinomycetota bacterium]
MGPLDVVGSGVLPPVAGRVRRLFWWLERFAPPVGSRWAVELWCTPPVLESSLRMPPGVSPGRPIEAYWDGHRVAGEEWGGGPPIYLVHGWGGQRPHLAVFVKPLVEAGYRVVAFDLPSHNESDPGALAPGRTTATECADAIAAVIETHGDAYAVIAHSLGANATALAAAQGAPVGRLVLVAPMGDFGLYLDLFAARHNFGRRIRAGLQRGLERRIAMPLQETNMTRIGRRANYPPLLVIHDPDDPDSPYAASERLVASWHGARLVTTRGLGRLAHYRILRHRPAINAGLEFIGAT